MNITQKYIPNKTLRRSGQAILGIKFIVCHDTGNPNSTAQENVDYYIRSANEVEASAHTFIDDINIIECIPQNEKAWHVRRVSTIDNTIFGFDSNDYALGIELCYFPNDILRSQNAYNNYVSYIRYLTEKYDLDLIEKIIGHYNLDPGRKTDPIDAFKIIGKTWDDFIKDLTSVQSKDGIKKEIVDLLNKL